MSRYPWRDTSEDIAKRSKPQWETPAGAQEKADKAEQSAKDYSDEKLNDHIGTGGDAHALAIPNGAAGFISGQDQAKLDGMTDGAEPNQNAFTKVNDVSAANETDTLTIEGGVGITVSTNPTTRKVIVTATGDATPGAHGPSHNVDGADPIPDLVTLRSEFDAMTPESIGAETPAGAQAKVDALAGEVDGQLADLMANGFNGVLQGINGLTDFNLLTTPGAYHGVLFDACYNEPIYPNAGARRVTIRVESQNPFIRQTITYESGFQSHSEYTRVFDGSWSEWVGVYNNFASLLPNGYQKLPSGVIIQWGAIQINMSGPVYDTGGLVFPTQHKTTNIVMSMNCSPLEAVSWTAGQGNIYPMNESQFRIMAFGDVGNSYYYRWMSIGF